MEPELPCQTNRLACFPSQIFGMSEKDKISFGLRLSNLVSQKTICNDDKNAGTMSTGLKVKNCLELTSLYYVICTNNDAFPLLM